MNVARRRDLRSALGVLVVTLGVLLADDRARADGPGLEGAVDARALIGIVNRVGGAVSTDLWVGRGRLRYGGSAGVGALSKGNRASSRVLTPMTFSFALLPRRDTSGPTLVARAGLYAGAQKGGFIWGPALSGALGYRFALGEGASFRLGADTWVLFMNRGGVFVGPYVGLGF